MPPSLPSFLPRTCTDCQLICLLVAPTLQHVVDDQSFPWVSQSLPAMSAQGAWGAPNPAMVATHTYSPADVQTVIAYAASWGIRVIPEFDTPGHSTVWEKGQPGLLSPCYNTSVNPPVPIPDTYGPIDPTKDSTFTFLQTLFTEIAAVFPDAYIHVGGDEVSFTCWASNPAINAWMAQNGIAAGDYAGLESYYVQKVLDLVLSLGKFPVGWQEIFDNHLNITGSIVNVWKYHNTGAPSPRGAPRDVRSGIAQGLGTGPTWQEELYNVTAAGHKAIVSSPWYLNYISYGLDWPQYLQSDILDFGGSAAQVALVMGGEVSMWGEFVDNTNFISRTWPRASAVGEALWTNPGAAADLVDAEARMLGQRCRMMNRGLPAEPANGPSYCPQEWVVPYNKPF